jgi:hypothetical protein
MRTLTTTVEESQELLKRSFEDPLIEKVLKIVAEDNGVLQEALDLLQAWCDSFPRSPGALAIRTAEFIGENRHG